MEFLGEWKGLRVSDESVSGFVAAIVSRGNASDVHCRNHMHSLEIAGLLGDASNCDAIGDHTELNAFVQLSCMSRHLANVSKLQIASEQRWATDLEASDRYRSVSTYHVSNLVYLVRPHVNLLPGGSIYARGKGEGSNKHAQRLQRDHVRACQILGILSVGDRDGQCEEEKCSEVRHGEAFRIQSFVELPLQLCFQECR